ncbi:PAS domain S-box protein [Mariprofundus erugo]|uniref:histidine kinase n=1 Tax=Mariprofundus erugo TaxID=2528639 RepID=A0A5R9GHS7_9PROT|nr:PAS domain S-box protein [Mariprofundus erugo]TLS65488.1 PAS domain S-box protein [Mariprofundus erugo]
MRTLLQKDYKSSGLIAFRILAVIVLAEASLMAGFRLFGINSSTLAAGVSDTLILAVVSSLVIYSWVIRPLRRAKQQNELFNLLVNHTDAGMIVTDPDNQHAITYINPAYSRMTGYAEADLVGEHLLDLQKYDPDAGVYAHMLDALDKGRSLRALLRHYRKDGSSFWGDLQLNPITGRDGVVQRWVWLINDVSEQRELARQNARWARAMQQADESVCVFDEQYRIEFANAAFCEHVGMIEADLAGADIRQFFAMDTDGESESMIEAIELKFGWSGRNCFRRADGTTYQALTSMTPIEQEDDTQAFVVVHRDITAMVAMEEQLRQAQKMEAIGMLVGGIAHDFNNVLAGILGNLYLVRKRLHGRPELQARIERVEQQGYGAAGMVRQLLSFARKGTPEVKVIDLVPFLKELIKFAHVSVPESILLDSRIEVERLLIRCDPVQLQQSLLNLIVNATHAVHDKGEGGGMGKIELVLDVAEPPVSAITDGQHGSWARISVHDNGIGMDDETRERMFDPFFTTKASTIGTGLGLTMVQGYVEMLHGLIQVASEPGRGTAITLWLPVAIEAYEADAQKEVTLRRGSGELLLLADDDHVVLDALSEILEGANYRVLSASSGEEALSLFARYEGQLDMAILDVVMPSGTGIEVARHMRSRQHGLPVVFMTGYDRQNALITDDSGRMMLRKPWNIGQLNHVLECSLSAEDHPRREAM